MLVTAAAMASGVGEIARISMTIPSAYEIGLAAAVIMGMVWARRGVKALAAGGGFLLPVCGLLYIVITLLGRDGHITPVRPPLPSLPVIPLAMGYACLNVTLCCGLLSEIASKTDQRAQRRAAAWFTVLIGVLLAGANAALLPHIGKVEHAALPMLILSRGSVAARLLATAALLLAMMTTLTALIRALSGWIKLPEWLRLGVVGITTAGLGLVGFTQLIGAAYP
jgi:uncharacterized membrane protein YkvI